METSRLLSNFQFLGRLLRLPLRGGGAMVPKWFTARALCRLSRGCGTKYSRCKAGMQGSSLLHSPKVAVIMGGFAGCL